MVTPVFATVVVAVAVLLTIVIIPILDGTPKFQKYISLRYTLVAISLIMALGCILDFSHLAESSRNIVLMGAMVLVGIFVIVRSLEKIKLGNKVIDVSVEKDGIKAKAKIENKDTQTNTKQAQENKETESKQDE